MKNDEEFSYNRTISEKDVPLYDLLCTNCGHSETIRIGINDKDLVSCPKCNTKYPIPSRMVE